MDYVLASFSSVRYRPAMPDDEKLSSADPHDLADAIAPRRSERRSRLDWEIIKRPLLRAACREQPIAIEFRLVHVAI
jgi:hypothetical protein